MRPARLEFEGFGTFRDRTVVDFDGIDLVAFVGPTGSGKSTVIDAMTFALYGSVARYDDTRLVAPVIHQLSTEAKVRFDFELGGASYTAVRVVRRVKSKADAPRATTREARLERLDGDGTSTVVAGSVSELDDEIQRLIGLDFGQFTRTIVLPQGEFAEFLKDDPGNRQKLLRRLLDIDIYARMGARARERASRAAQQVEVYERELERLVEVTTQRLADAKRKVDALRRFGDEVGVKLGELAAVDRDLTERRNAVTEIDLRLGALAGIQVDSGADAVRDEAQRAQVAMAEAQAALASVRAEREASAAELEAAGDRSSIERQLAVHARLGELDQEVAALERELEEARTAHADSVTTAAENDRALDEATAALTETRTGADVAVWVAKLAPGQPCPVCRQDVVDVPSHLGHDAVAEIEQREADARKAARTATATTAKAEGRVQSLDAEVGQRRKERADLGERVGRLDTR